MVIKHDKNIKLYNELDYISSEYLFKKINCDGQINTANSNFPHTMDSI